MSEQRLEQAQHDARREAAPFVLSPCRQRAARSEQRLARLAAVRANDWWVWLVLALPAVVLAAVFLLGLGRIGI